MLVGRKSRCVAKRYAHSAGGYAAFGVFDACYMTFLWRLGGDPVSFLSASSPIRWRDRTVLPQGVILIML